MYAQAGDERLYVGHCHPGGARKLVKKELASWDNGDLILILQPVYLKFMEQDFWTGERDHEISRAELDRRRHWFKNLVSRGAQALLSQERSDLTRLLDYTATLVDVIGPTGSKVFIHSRLTADISSRTEEDIWDPEELLHIAPAKDTGEKVSLTEEQLEAHIASGDFWDTAPPVHEIFKIKPRPKTQAKLLSDTDLVEYREKVATQIRLDPLGEHRIHRVRFNFIGGPLRARAGV